MNIDYSIFQKWKNQPILKDEDCWEGKYKTYGDMWKGEGYMVTKRTGLNKTEYIPLSED